MTKARDVIVGWLLVCAGILVAARLVVALPEQCGDATPASVDAAIDNTMTWLEGNQLPDGTWLYRYRAATDQDLGGYNWVRHAGTMLALYQAAAAGEPNALDVADRGRTPILERQLVTQPDGSIAVDDGRLTTGGTALLVAALTERAAITGTDEDDELLRALGRFLVNQVEPRGSVLEGTTHSPFSTGEAFYALAKLHLRFPGEGWDEPAMRIADYVITDRANDEGYVPDVSDHWSAYGFATMRQWPERASGLTSDELGFVRRQLGLMSIQTRYETQRTNSGVSRLRGHQALGAGIGTIGEAMGQWWLVGASEPALDGTRGALRDRITCMAGATVERQIDATEAQRYPRPDRVRGSYLQFGITQVDDQQHTLSALLAAREVLTDITPLPKRSPIPTNMWVTMLAALAALNPVRLAAGSAGVRRKRMKDVGIAGGIAVGAVALLAVIGGPLLRALDVSAANALVAAALALIGGAIYCLATPNEAEPAGLLVPLIIPLALRPDLLFFAIAVGAGGRGWGLLASVVIGVVAAVVVAALPPPKSIVHLWLMRVIGTVGLVTAVALLVDGVYSI